MLSIIDSETQRDSPSLFAYQRQFFKATLVSHWQHIITSLFVSLFHFSLYMSPLAPPSLHVEVRIITFPLLRELFASSQPRTHHHGTLSRAHSIIDILRADPLAVLAHHTSRGRLSGCPLGWWWLLGGVRRVRDGAATGTGCHSQCRITPGSLWWLYMKENYLGICCELGATVSYSRHLQQQESTILTFNNNWKW